MSENTSNTPDLNEVFEEEMDDATVITVPIDTTLSHSGEAAEAAAVGAALALKANLSDVVSIDVNGQDPDNQGHILIDGTDIPMSSTDETTLKEAIETVDAKTGADIVMGEEDSRTLAEAIAEAAASSGDINAENVMMAEGSQVSVAAKIANMDVVAGQNSTDIAGLKAKTANEIQMSGSDSTTVKQAIEGKISTVNGEGPDETGNVQMTHALTADDLTSANSQQSVGEFVRRTTGGSAPIHTGSAWMGLLRGKRSHIGYSAESLTHSATQAPREEGDEPLSYTIDEATFKTAVSGATTTKVFTYSTEWSENLATYGLTAENAISGDHITVIFSAENRGTIIQSNPVTFISTGWNLFNKTAGYAVALKYADPARFRIRGTYTSVKYSSTLTGTKTTVTPVDGLFTVSANGYIWVENSGGSLDDVQIYMTWTDWVGANDGPSAYAAYSESVINMSALFDEEDCAFPYGLLQVADIRDEVNFNTGIATSKVGRLAYSAENLALVQGYGRAYECDTDYIYYELAEYAEVDLDELEIDGSYDADDHGLEMFTGSDIAVYAVTVYGNSLKNKLETDVATLSAQTLSDAQKGQVQENLGVSGLIGIVENGSTASQAISKGQYVIWKGALYTADAAISSGATLAASGGSKNLTACTSGGLNALNSNCTPVSFTGFEPATGFVEEHNYSFMLNGVLYVQYGAKKSSGKITANTWTKIATITDSSITLPTGNFVIPCVSIGATAAARGMINANGELQIYVTGSNDCTGGCLTGMLF